MNKTLNLMGLFLSNQPSYGNALDEWKEARSVIARFDNNLHDLRKYGFSFVTALLAANGLISQGGSSVVSVGVKAGILVATMGLIVTLKLLDTHYRRFQQAVSIRGRILEDRLNIDLTKDLSFFYALENWWKDVQALYYGFLMLTALLGFAILWSHWVLIILILIAALFSGALIQIINDEKRARKSTALEDWSVDNKIVNEGTPVRITFTNLNSGNRDKPGTFNLRLSIKKNLSGKPEESDVMNETSSGVQLRYFENCDWLWETKECHQVYTNSPCSPTVQKSRRRSRSPMANSPMKRKTRGRSRS